MRIAIDARPLNWPGIGRYIRELVIHLAYSDDDNDYYIWVNEGLWEEALPELPDNFNVVLFGSRVHSIFEQAEFIWRIFRDKIDILHCPSSLVSPIWCPCTMVLTVHDMLLFSKPELLPSMLARLYFLSIHHRGIQQAKKIITVSEYTLNELIKHHPDSYTRTKTIYNGISPVFFEKEAYAKSYNDVSLDSIIDNYFVAVGSLKKHKNFNRLVRAYSSLDTSITNKYKLIIVTNTEVRNPDNSLVETISELGLHDNVKLISNLTDQELAMTYSRARGFISVSISEGFGLPVAEAMACGAPLIISDIEVFHEVAQDAAMYVNPEDIASITASLRILSNDDMLAHTLSEKGLARSMIFSWENNVAMTLLTYHDAIL